MDEGKPTDNWQIKPEYLEKWNELFSAKVDLAITPLDPADLDDVKLSAADMVELKPILKK